MLDDGHFVCTESGYNNLCRLTYMIEKERVHISMNLIARYWTLGDTHRQDMYELN